MSNVTLLRTLTRKSQLKYGHRHSQTVERVLMERPYMLVFDYYNLSAINFTDDVLDELGITERIQKPGKVTKEDWQHIKVPFVEKYWWSDDTRDLVMRGKSIRTLRAIQRKPKAYYQAKNHGR